MGCAWVRVGVHGREWREAKAQQGSPRAGQPGSAGWSGAFPLLHACGIFLTLWSHHCAYPLCCLSQWQSLNDEAKNPWRVRGGKDSNGETAMEKDSNGETLGVLTASSAWLLIV